MATVTAHVLIGGTHPNHDGILPTHTITVSEGARAALLLNPFHMLREGAPASQPSDPLTVVWIPSPLHVVDDLLLQIGVHVLRDRELIAQVETVVPGLSKADRVELDALNADERTVLTTACTTVAGYPKLVVTLMGGSILKQDITRFEDYSMDIEVCTVAFQRQYSVWQNKTHITGSLDAIAPRRS